MKEREKENMKLTQAPLPSHQSQSQTQAASKLYCRRTFLNVIGAGELRARPADYSKLIVRTRIRIKAAG